MSSSTCTWVYFYSWFLKKIFCKIEAKRLIFLFKCNNKAPLFKTNVQWSFHFSSTYLKPQYVIKHIACQRCYDIKLSILYVKETIKMPSHTKNCK